MNDISIAFAKLAGIRHALQSLLDETTPRHQHPISNFSPRAVRNYFTGAADQLKVLQTQLGELFGDFPSIQTEPLLEMAEGSKDPIRFDRVQLESLRRDIDQIFEIRANSELATPANTNGRARVFISHGHANDWREVQSFIENDVEISTLELEYEPNLGRSVLQKLDQEASKCTSAVIVMTGDDIDAEGNPTARQNVMHEIGFLQAKLGLAAVCLLHEEGTIIPSNIQGLVYIPFPKGYVKATFAALQRELKSYNSL